MTIGSSTSKSQHSGNGVTVNFATGFVFFLASHIKVVRTQISTGVDTQMANPGDFSVTGGNGAAGTVTMAVAPTADQRITIYREVDPVQNTNFGQYTDFPAESMEDALDYLTMQTQQLQEAAGRVVTLAQSTTLTDNILMDNPVATKGLKISADGTRIIMTADDPDEVLPLAQGYAAAAAASAASASASAGSASTSAGTATAAASAASASATLAQQWATLTSGQVAATDYSAKEYAIGTQAATGGSSKNWAQQAGAVTGAGANDRSAKSWAQADLKGATLGGSARDWAVTAHNTLVNATEYSAYHWAVEAAAIVGAASGVVKVTTNDTLASVLNNKLTVSGGLVKSITNPGGNEAFNIAAPPSPSLQIFTSSGTWNKPAGANVVMVEEWAGGGGGGAGQGAIPGAGGSGGGGGQYNCKLFLASELGASESVTIGAGGPQATAGGDTTFGTKLLAKGGGAGVNGAGANANGGRGGGLARAFSDTDFTDEVAVYVADFTGGFGGRAITGNPSFSQPGAMSGKAGGGGASGGSASAASGGDSGYGLYPGGTGGAVGGAGTAGLANGGAGGGGGGINGAGGGVGGNGGAGGAPAGGGGGGGNGSSGGGSGGVGARGEVRVTVW